MKIAAVTLSVILLAGTVYAKEKIVLKDVKDKVSYSIGLDIGKNFKSQSIDINPDILVKGIKDAVSESKPLMTDEEIRDTMTNFRNEMKAKQEKRMGEAENKKKEGVVTLPSGLQYKIITEGKGDNPKPTDMVTVNYRGTLIDGTEFDSSASHGHGEPSTFKVSGVIPGWVEALQLMKPGSKWQLFIPPSLAYGEHSAGRNIGPNTTLIFEVELISIQ